MKLTLANVLNLTHRHHFHTTRTNPYLIPTEQQCLCGLYRHHTAADLTGVPMGAEPNWKQGRHPAEITTTPIIISTPRSDLPTQP